MFNKNEMEKLVCSAKSGNKQAMEDICLSFKGYIINKSAKIYIKGYDMEDLIQEGYVSVIKAVAMYDIKRNSFTTYVDRSIDQNFFSIMRKNLGKPYNCSLNSVNQEGSELVDTLVSDENIEQYFEMVETESELKNSMDKLSADEREIVYWYYVEGKSLRDYCVVKKISYRTAVYKKRTAIDKLRRLMKKRNRN